MSENSERPYRPFLGAVLGCFGLLAFPASCVCLAWMEPPTAMVSPDYPFPSGEEKAAMLVSALLLAGGGYVALRIGSGWSKRPPAP